MTESMIERVARAIYASHPAEYEPDKFETQHPWTQEACRAQARAAIAAMRGPSEAMVEHPSYINGEWSRRNIEAFIDAALSEEKETA